MMSRAAETTPRTVPSERDLTLDLTRVVCVVVVVFVHILFAGVGRGTDGSLVIEKTVESLPVFVAGSWLANIMPLFFVVGGFAARIGWRSAAARGESADRFARVRLERLARPAVPVLVFFTAALGVSRLLGLDPALVDTIAVGVGSPLWFLAAYLLAQAAAPFMMRMHERHGMWVLATLLAAGLIVDATRFLLVGGVFGIDGVPASGYGFGQEVFGIPNILFIWLFAQQVGFFLCDGWFSERSLWQILALIAGGYALLGVLVWAVGYPTSMLANQWPPTVPMAVLAVVQTALLTLLHRPLTALMHTKPARAAVFLIGSRLMTIYLWHLPVIMILIGLELLLPLPMPDPGSALWWWTRPLFLLVVMAAVWLLSLWLVRFEATRHRGTPRFAGVGATVAAVAVFAAPVVAITLYGLDLTLAASALAGAACALWLTGSRRSL
ncbi:acyltransferase family protein [Microbacterium sp. 179-I 3D4 NHS]|uniref:acyltransferase family protein n=1 Tax=Microbacterium sp. 179-I 3D4 NHS TaxID=3142381 RepID=UPI0039A279C6